jgi:GrpB-like predicted nucleotidyltransferase (UPF0157 family)
VWAISVTQDIVISDYDPTWPAWFDTVRHHVWPAVKGVALRIDHVGSTAVPGLAAKPSSTWTSSSRRTTTSAW